MACFRMLFQNIRAQSCSIGMLEHESPGYARGAEQGGEGEKRINWKAVVLG